MQNSVWRNQQFFEQPKDLIRGQILQENSLVPCAPYSETLKKSPMPFLYMAIKFLIQDVNKLLLARNRRSI